MPRSFARRDLITKPSYEAALDSIAGADHWHLQEQSGAVALVTNDALALGRELVLDPGFDDATKWTLNTLGTSWSIAAGVAHCTSVDVFCQINADTVPIHQGKTYELRFTISNAATFAQMDIYTTSASDVNKLIILTSYANGSYIIPVPAAVGTISPSPGISLVFLARSAGSAFDMDDVSFKQTDILASSVYAPGTNPMDGTNNSMAIGQTAGGNLGYRYLGDGATTYLDVKSAEHNSKLNPTSFQVWLWLQKTTWDTTERDILSYTVDANNWIRIVDSTTAGTLSFQFRAGGTTEEVTLATGSPTTDVLVGLSVAGGVMKAWYRDTQTGSNQAVAGAFVGNFATMLIGARTTTPTFVHNGAVSHIGTASRE